MFNFYVIFLGFLILIASFLELLVFNEEVLLTLCFLSFIFFIYTSLGESISSNFSEQARKYENGLLSAFNDKFVILKDQVLTLYPLTNISNNFLFFEYILITFVQKRKNSIERSLSISSSSLILNKFAEISNIEQKIIVGVQNKILKDLLYPLIFSSFKAKPIALFSAVKKSEKTFSVSTKERAFILKSLIKN